MVTDGTTSSPIYDRGHVNVCGGGIPFMNRIRKFNYWAILIILIGALPGMIRLVHAQEAETGTEYFDAAASQVSCDCATNPGSNCPNKPTPVPPTSVPPTA